ncbi:ABC transporter permease [Myxococcus sp. MISCRS1]|uniref:ABC transporter permease n=1 Tax=unclassified Myxococcus TaxID=2648731 RepID=UPI001CBE71A9|nr:MULTISPECIES: ABC transporter permease [unclassified Myxococcus]MBZ4412676.1 ABC transporter permease [Myxococcus sp. XM-1-1-1]MCY1000088.1 ABC transporter permease [Myxococcus sp. MISCRS1]BDT38362.1 ABC transporter permease [Myxococcus sp. MH1]
MENLLQDVRLALRSLRKSPGFTLVAVLALALGIGANSAVFSVVNGVLLVPPPFAAPDRLMDVSNDFARAGRKGLTSSVAEYQDAARLPVVFSSVAAYTDDSVTLTGVDTPQSLVMVEATASFLPTLGVAPMLGRNFTEAEQTQGNDRVVVLTHQTWRAHFSEDPSVLGRTLQLNGEPYTVIGVLPRGVAFPAGSQLYKPFAPSAELASEDKRDTRFLEVMARLKPGVTLEAAREDLERVSRQLAQEHPKYAQGQRTIALKSLEDEVVGEVRGTLWLLLGAVGFVLLVACGSVANLLLARAAAREREVSIRAALGANRARLVAQFLTESLLLSLLGGALGLLFALWGTDVLLAFVGDALPRAAEVRLEVRSVLFTGGVSLLSGLVFGLVPALQASRADLNAAMREGSRGTAGGRSGKLRSGLVVGQVAFALVLLVGAGLFGRSLLALLSVDPGFRPEGVLTARLTLPENRYATTEQQGAFQRELLTRLQALPGVESAGLTNLLPLGRSVTFGFDIDGRTKGPDEVWPAVQLRTVSPDYLSTLGMRLREGRLLEATDVPGTAWAVVINKTFADAYWPQGNALGQRLKLRYPKAEWATVVGIVEDAREWALDKPVVPMAYYSLPQLGGSHLALAVRTKAGAPEALRAGIAAELRQVDADVPLFGVAPLTRLVDESIGARRLSALLMGLFGGTALLLAALGLAGVIGYSVAQRTRELGIRMALGAARSDVLWLVLRQGLSLAGLGVVLGLGLSLGLAHLLRSLLYGVAAYDAWTFAGVAALLGAVALAATWLPARRATRVDPIISLRSE